MSPFFTFSQNMTCLLSHPQADPYLHPLGNTEILFPSFLWLDSGLLCGSERCSVVTFPLLQFSLNTLIRMSLPLGCLFLMEETTEETPGNTFCVRLSQIFRHICLQYLILSVNIGDLIAHSSSLTGGCTGLGSASSPR